MTPEEREQHERATKIRKMTDAKICGLLDNLSKLDGKASESCEACQKNGSTHVCFNLRTGLVCPNFLAKRADLP